MFSIVAPTPFQEEHLRSSRGSPAPARCIEWHAQKRVTVKLRVTYVKIDGRIVRDLLTDPASEVIVGSLVRLARLRTIECIAEWVEARKRSSLCTLGVRYAQGYFLDAPAPMA